MSDIQKVIDFIGDQEFLIMRDGSGYGTSHGYTIERKGGKMGAFVISQNEMETLIDRSRPTKGYWRIL